MISQDLFEYIIKYLNVSDVLRLSMINGDFLRFIKIHSYSNDEAEGHYFNRDVKILDLSIFSDLRELYLEDIPLYIPPLNLPHLKTLQFYGCRDVNDESIKFLTQVEDFYCTRCKITSLNHMQKLKSIGWTGTDFLQTGIDKLLKVKSFSTSCKNSLNLNHMKELEELEISNSQITDSDIRELTNLKVLSIGKNITDLSRFTKLTSLTIVNDNLTEDSIKHLPNLEVLDISNAPNVKNIDFLTHLKELRVGNSLNHMGLTNLINLRSLAFSGNFSRGFQLRYSIVHLRNLTNLHTNYDLLTQQDISELYNLQSLVSYASTVTNLNHLKNLRHLILRKNKIITSEGLSELTNMVVLDIKGSNNITSINTMTKLEILTCDKSLTQEGIMMCTSLTDITLNNNVNIKNLNHCQNLRVISTKNRLNLDGIKDLKNLEVLIMDIPKTNFDISRFPKLRVVNFFDGDHEIRNLEVNGVLFRF